MYFEFDVNPKIIEAMRRGIRPKVACITRQGEGGQQALMLNVVMIGFLFPLILDMTLKKPKCSCVEVRYGSVICIKT